MNVSKTSEAIFLEVQGRLDYSSGERLKHQLRALKPEPHSLWMLDLTHVEFIDSSGLVALVSGLKMAGKHQCRLVICNPHPSVRLILEITQLDDVFEIIERPIEVAA